MVTVDVSQLTGVALEWALAEALPETRPQEVAPDGHLVVERGGALNCGFEPQLWRHGGPLIDRFDVEFLSDEYGKEWCAMAYDETSGPYYGLGENHLQAMCRALIVMHRGSKGLVPEDLV